MNPSAALNIISIKKRIPLSVTFELTYDCPLSCAHCYLTEKNAKGKKMLTAGQAVRVLEILKKAGAMSAAFTGGEPLLRKDLPEICLAAKKLNIDFSVYTSLVTANYHLLKKLKESGLKKLEVSLYGAQKEHEAVTKTAGTYRLTMKNLELAKALGFKIKLKTPLTGLNPKGPYFVKETALKNGFSFAADPLLSPKNDGNCLPSYVRAKKRDIEKLVMRENRADRPFDFHSSDKFPLCSAGFNTAAVNPYGELYPCIQFPCSFGNLLKKDFSSLWKSEKAENFRKMLYIRPAKCLDCRLSDYCSYCPGFDYVKRNASKPDEYFCFIALCSRKAMNFRPLKSGQKNGIF